MPHLSMLFESSVDASMRDAAVRISASSAFEPQITPFHVPLIGALHTYTSEEIQSAIEATPAVRGRFVGWELHDAQYLRAVVQLDPDCIANLHMSLPRGRPWTPHYVTLGSVAGIEAAHHEEFVAAVRDAFAMDESLVFTSSQLVCQTDRRPPQSSTDAATAGRRLNPKARPFVPALVQTVGKTKQKPHRASQHKTWHRYASMSVDEPTKSSAVFKRAKRKAKPNVKALKAAQRRL
jgi:hypothetical protein